MDIKTLNEWLKFAGTLLAVSASFWLGFKWARRKLDRFLRLPELLADVATHLDFLDARQQITCKKLGIGIYLCDAKGHCTFVSRHLAEIWGVEPDSCLGSGWLSQISEQRETLHQWEFAVKNRLHYESYYTVTNACTHKKVRIRSEAFWFPNGCGGFVGFVEIVSPTHQPAPVNLTLT